jgi:hypothetical protein
LQIFNFFGEAEAMFIDLQNEKIAPARFSERAATNQFDVQGISEAGFLRKGRPDERRTRRTQEAIKADLGKSGRNPKNARGDQRARGTDQTREAIKADPKNAKNANLNIADLGTVNGARPARRNRHCNPAAPVMLARARVERVGEMKIGSVNGENVSDWLNQEQEARAVSNEPGTQPAITRGQTSYGAREAEGKRRVGDSGVRRARCKRPRVQVGAGHLEH